MKFALIGHRRSDYYRQMLEELITHNLKPEYIIIEDYDVHNLSESSYFIDHNTLLGCERGSWHYETDDTNCMIADCLKKDIPFFVVDNQTGQMSIDIMRKFPIDILLITEGPIFRGEILYIPRYCVMNMHAAPLPKFRGNWTTRLAIYNDEPLYVSAHCVSRGIDAGAIIDRISCPIFRSDTLEQIDKRAVMKAIELAARVLCNIDKNGFSAKKQRMWEGIEYRGEYVQNVLLPAMPLELQQELEKRLEKQQYGFYKD